MPEDHGIPRARLLAAMTVEGLDDLSQSIRRSLGLADKTAEALRDWLRLVEDALERKAGF